MMNERLIMSVFRHPVVWNMRMEHYRERTRTNNAWKQISVELSLPEKDCRRKWRDLRDRYVRERREATEPTSGATMASHRRPWGAAPLLAFLDPFISSRPATATSNLPKMETEAVRDGPSDVEAENEREWTDEGVPDRSSVARGRVNESTPEGSSVARGRVNESASDVTVVVSERVNENAAEGPSTLKKRIRVSAHDRTGADSERGLGGLLGRKRKVGGRDVLSEFEANLLLALEKMKTPPPPAPVQDEDELFLLSLLPALRRLDIRDKARVKLDIHRLVYQAEFQLSQGTSETGPTSPHLSGISAVTRHE
ncbi:uncharacterized protein LOC121690909 [Alosa sapidissima]|uniref:uncharacterized protein LOC121690909 n=1 Tax=Alosa sapidissima TaxID=34773 RepID=UPI001C08B0FD|nr:uncharacterized protein LOC121690909 [Alosa sapidissima]XP_041927070.1 uncharacterized protein LOC121690909 [Alosa sapidissima]XP_041927071.1 uncharacterized protein LOC121690909 [Alosa sapidissima]XP_041927072.1 uncharacterized protein LOC121690909 [Alosa sapidissima]